MEKYNEVIDNNLIDLTPIHISEDPCATQVKSDLYNAFVLTERKEVNKIKLDALKRLFEANTKNVYYKKYVESLIIKN